MSRNLAAAKSLCAIAVLAFGVSTAFAQAAPAASGAPMEASPVVSHPAVSGPISHNYKLTKIDGTINVLVNPDGTWLFSGSSRKSLPGKDIDISLALKNTTGATIVLQWVGDASHGFEFSKQGTNVILKDDFSTFASSHKSAWEYRVYESAAGRRQEYEAQLRKREQLLKEQEEAKKRHDEKVAAEKKAALKKEEQEQLAQEKAKQAQQQSSGGGGSSVGSVLSTIGSIAGAVLAFL
jgi:hypothetical protein